MELFHFYIPPLSIAALGYGTFVAVHAFRRTEKRLVRPWYQFHLSTCFALMLLTGLIIGEARWLYGATGASLHDPETAASTEITLVLNAYASVALLCLVAVFCEWNISHKGKTI
jgi:hypothetical protein